MQDTRLTLRELVARPVVLKLQRPVIARIAIIEEWPLILIDLHTEEGITGRSYLEPYIVKSMIDLVPASILCTEAFDTGFTGSVLDLLRQDQETQVGQAVAEIVALDADAQLAAKLAIEPGHAVLLLEEVVFDTEGESLDCSRNYFVPEFFRFRVVRR